MIALYCLVAAEAAAAPLAPAAPLPPAAEQRLARDILAQLVGTDTSAETGSTTSAAQAVAKRLRAAGFPAADVQVLGPVTRKQNLVARLRGTGQRKPLLLLGHLDVVQALRGDWSMPPYHLTEQDGWFYGRGVQDMKALCTYWVANLLRLRREGFRPDRDIVLALTADEEAGNTGDNGAHWLAQKHLDLIRAELALNEGGSGEVKNGRRRANDVMASEKGFQGYRLEVRNRGGHSSLPRKDNAIVQLAEGLVRLARHEFPARLDPVMRLYFAGVASLETGAVATDVRALAQTPAGAAPDPAVVARLSAIPQYNARLRTTCTPTRLEGGHADNALPQLAAALVNCRLLPGDTPDGVRAAIVKVLGDPAIEVKPVGEWDAGPVGPPGADILAAVERVTGRHFPGVKVLPVMSSGATDGRFLRAAGIPTYGVSGLFADVDDVRAHGRDERIAVQAFYEGQEFAYDLIKELAGAGAHP